ncbi:4890_t:CDS:10 [Acaulospora morrowiae]|uniref:4890_t:CDS:1 n=1 Tax=Acaulospora morrowiae TaxID=94023 RepID=A0A9N9A8C5_9GLOM|nr:4890_t:CDS:10 [Acaulospora morrowiae]
MSLNVKEETDIDREISTIAKTKVSNESEIDPVVLPTAKRLKISPEISEATEVNLSEISSTASNSLAPSGGSDVTSTINDLDCEERGIRYRLRIENISKYVNAKTIKKFLAKNDCGKLQVKKSSNWDYCYVHLNSREQQLDVIGKLKDAKLKNKLIIVKADNTTEQERQDLVDARRKKLFPDPKEDQRSPEEMLADQITPLYRLTYSEQLKAKGDGIINALSRFLVKTKELYTDRSQPKRVTEELESNLPFEVHTIISSPILEGYRNKCEFTIGKNHEGEKTVGYLLGAFKNGFNVVMGPEKSLNTGEVSKKIAVAMQEYVRGSDLDVYDRATKQGNWRLVCVRSQTCGDVMVIVQFHPQGLTEERIKQEKVSLTEYFVNYTREAQIDLKSLLVQSYDGVSNGLFDKHPLECIFGVPYIHEEMMGCRFRISPHAFFQTNTLAAQVLYEKCGEYIKDLCHHDKPPPILIDMCCGTGTIGIALSKVLGNKIKEIIGIEICEEAVEDAKYNATLNEISNTQYILGPVEKNLYFLSNYNNREAGTVIAILDPPRAGVHKNVIKALRQCQAIDYLLYVSCDCNLATQNFIDLCKPLSRSHPGTPFKPVRAVGIDLFPHAKQVELLIEFHRDTDQN